MATNATACGMGSLQGDPISSAQINPQTVLLDAVIPGFSIFSSTLQRYTKIDLTLYIPIIAAIAGLAFAFKYVHSYLWELMECHFMSTADIRVDDEIYNMIMGWVAHQKFARKSRRFVANTNLGSRSWFVVFADREREQEHDSEGEDSEDVGERTQVKKKEKKPLQYTPSFGTHYFWYKGRLLVFKRTQDTRQSYVPASEREEISVSCFGRDPTVLKSLLNECRETYSKNDENKTLIYRGAMKPGTSEPTWIRCMSRVSRPFSTVVLDENVKKSLLDDMSDYLHPHTRRWYSNRGIPYRRGYLLYGPPGTGKSSLSFAIAGHFDLKIYIVSLNSPAMNEENLGTLFAELPKECVVLLEDIDTAGLTHTRDKPEVVEAAAKQVSIIPAGVTPGVPTANSTGGKISLSALLNILDGVASVEGRVLIMTTNHIDKLDDALIRPGRVDMRVQFNLASTTMIKTIFRGIFATLEGDFPSSKTQTTTQDSLSETSQEACDEGKRKAKVEEESRISGLGERFSKIVPNERFSPAEIQGYLLKYKREAHLAVENAAEWVKSKEEDRSKKEAEMVKEREKLLTSVPPTPSTSPEAENPSTEETEGETPTACCCPCNASKKASASTVETESAQS
ncbi:hypothetical protein PVAG01_00586 [Phlyctema vagabunda]|uniref:BCS1-like protein n=1 Tax=Phlyctema vagabunda TaxID=108571 RepID=A0ABR4PUN9_9HELO